MQFSGLFIITTYCLYINKKKSFFGSCPNIPNAQNTQKNIKFMESIKIALKHIKNALMSETINEKH